MDFCTLYSGSTGNAAYVAAGDFGILVDAGVSCTRVLAGLKSQGISPSAIKALFLTHNHEDHIKGVSVLCKKLNIPVYASMKMWQALADKINVPLELQRIFCPDQPLYLGPLAITPFVLPHDGAETVGYAFFDGKHKICTATDLGHIPPGFYERVKGANVLLLESNHEVDMLLRGTYPEFLKQRILSKHGHLSNQDAARAVFRGLNLNIRHVVLAHLSLQNNTPQRALQTVKDYLTSRGVAVGRDIYVTVAPSDTPGYFYHTEVFA